MVQFPLCVTFCLVSGLAMAQGVPPERRVGSLAANQEARRGGDIREVLKNVNTGASAPAVPGANPVPMTTPPYQLSPKGRAELREQLRREQQEQREQPAFRGGRP